MDAPHPPTRLLQMERAPSPDYMPCVAHAACECEAGAPQCHIQGRQTLCSSPPGASYLTDSNFPSLCTPGGLSPKSLGIQMLRAERVLQWMRPRGHACHTLYLDFSNINHDFDGRRFEVLLSLAPCVRTLHIVNMFGPGPSEFPEVFLSLQQLERLHIEGFPAQFLVTAAPYLKALPNLQHLHFKSDSPSCPTAIGPLPPSLQSLELEGMWIEEWPSNLPRAFSASDAASPTGRTRSGRSAALHNAHSTPLNSMGHSASLQQLQHISLHSCHFAPGLFAELMSTEGTPSLSFIWCTLVRLSLDDVPHIFPDIHPPPHHRISPGSPISVVKLHKVQPSLTSLTYVGCGLQMLRPEVTSCLQHLQHLNLSQSALGHPEAFPDEFRLLDRLTSLDLSECSLVVLHPNVAALPALQHINLENNALTGLPLQVAFAHSLRSAQLAHNRLPALPQCLLEDAKGLETLTVSSGVIAGTPLHVLDSMYLQLPNLVQLSVKGNKFESRAVHNLLRLSKKITLSGAVLHIDVTPSE
uniref:Uncharacterized protein n=1 Tax=Dunaliella tertiolecta TaxID=3047 RepID=A0A7S3QPW4_DUNTE|mmetsp:Transcript_4995/g.13569  ORF Transcript_4995/g.13569 Transcript_4995/m.13569 type:complete len:526 (-) Transcript_4995:376-1953(-)